MVADEMEHVYKEVSRKAPRDVSRGLVVRQASQSFRQAHERVQVREIDDLLLTSFLDRHLEQMDRVHGVEARQRRARDWRLVNKSETLSDWQTIAPGSYSTIEIIRP